MKANRLLIFGLFLVLVSCNKERKFATVNLDFQTTYNGSNIDLSSTFFDSQGRGIRFELIKFYLSNITVVTAGGEEKMVHEIGLIDLNDAGFGTLEMKVPAGNYSKLKLGIGVPDNLNEMDPSNFNEDGHPLSTQQNTYWGMNGMYRFVMVEGRYDLEPDQVFDDTFTYHTGFSSSYRNTEYTGNFDFKKKESYHLSFVIKVDEILEGPGGNLDIVNEPTYHGESSLQYLADMVSDNFMNAIYLKQ